MCFIQKSRLLGNGFDKKNLSTIKLKMVKYINGIFYIKTLLTIAGLKKLCTLT